MISIPSEISVRFNSALAKNRIPNDYQNHYRKWLRYYLDFCQKYNFQSIQPDSLQNFLEKVGGKTTDKGTTESRLHMQYLYITK